MKISVAKDFSETPGPALASEGEFSGETFREEVLWPALREVINTNEVLTVDLDGTAGYGAGFLEEAFGGLIRTGHIEEFCSGNMKVVSEKHENHEKVLMSMAYAIEAESNDGACNDFPIESCQEEPKGILSAEDLKAFGDKMSRGFDKMSRAISKMTEHLGLLDLGIHPEIDAMTDEILAKQNVEASRKIKPKESLVSHHCQEGSEEKLFHCSVSSCAKTIHWIDPDNMSISAWHANEYKWDAGAGRSWCPKHRPTGWCCVVCGETLAAFNKDGVLELEPGMSGQPVTSKRWFIDRIDPRCPKHFEHRMASYPLNVRAVAKYIKPKPPETEKPYDGTVSDGYHTFDELYDFRMAYNAALFNEWAAAEKYMVHKSRKHNDGRLPFGKDEMFIVSALLPSGQISNHYDVEHWDLFQCLEVPYALFEYDGHNSKDVLERLKSLPHQGGWSEPEEAEELKSDALEHSYESDKFCGICSGGRRAQSCDLERPESSTEN